MLLVDHDEAEADDRREDRAARAEHDVGRALAHAAVLGRPLGRGEGRVPDRDPLAEPGPQAPEQLRREGDLRHQDQAAPPRARAASIARR